MPRRALSSTLFPYTTLFRSLRHGSPAQPPARPPRPCAQFAVFFGAPRRRHSEVAANSRTISARTRQGHARYIGGTPRSEEHTSELQSQSNLVCRLLLEKKKT